MRRNRTILGKQSQLPGVLPILIEDRQRVSPGGLLRIIDLAEVGYLSLHDLAVIAAAVLHHAEIAVRFAVLEAMFAAQEHRYCYPKRE